MVCDPAVRAVAEQVATPVVLLKEMLAGGQLAVAPPAPLTVSVMVTLPVNAAAIEPLCGATFTVMSTGVSTAEELATTTVVLVAALLADWVRSLEVLDE
jgi:hypothetical protein